MSVLAVRAAVLVAVWMLVLASGDPVDLLLGVLAAAAVAVLPRPGAAIRAGRVSPARRVLALPLFVAAVLVDIAQGTWDIALRVLHARPIEHPGIVEVPVGDRTELGVAVSALAATLSPGTVLVDVDQDRGVMLLHVIDASDPDRVRADLQRFYDRAQRRVFP